MGSLTAQVIKFSQTGGADVLKLVSESVLPPAQNEITIRQKAIGVNFVDTYYRSGLYASTLPSGLGSEAAGVVEAVGSAVKDFKVGDRVAYATGTIGSYADLRNFSADHTVKLPDGISFELAASVMLKGLTVQYLFTQTYQISKDEIFLFHAAAGGVGQLACQFARHVGAKLIGTISSEEKSQIALKQGAWKTINYRTENIAEKLLEYTEGQKVSVVYDSIGMSTFETSLNCLKTRGLFVSYGNASGAVTGVNLGILAQKGSLYVTRPVLGAYVKTAEELKQSAHKLFELIQSGALKPETPKSFKLAEARDAHLFLESKERTGSLILIP